MLKNEKGQNDGNRIFFMFIFTFCPPLKKDILMKKKKNLGLQRKKGMHLFSIAPNSKCYRN